MISVSKAAAMLGLTVSYVYTLCYRGVLRHQRIGKSIRLKPDDVLAFQDKHMITRRDLAE